MLRAFSYVLQFLSRVRNSCLETLQVLMAAELLLSTEQFQKG